MATSTQCSLNFSPRSPTPGLDISSSKSNTSQIAWPRDDRWRKQCVLGMASMIIALQVGDSNAIAKEIRSRWSEKRMCPPWHENSLETIVPENLPRPSAHRRWEDIGFSKNAPAIKVTVVRKTTASCFSM
ncbi:hypothetical protein PTKIN_Ptkin19aG0029500 [Pterospermum kingtungense]